MIYKVALCSETGNEDERLDTQDSGNSATELLLYVDMNEYQREQITSFGNVNANKYMNCLNYSYSITSVTSGLMWKHN